jgi:regulator of protease activity HflC (stomatin/prohibitin superfamily)
MLSLSVLSKCPATRIFSHFQPKSKSSFQHITPKNSSLMNHGVNMQKRSILTVIKQYEKGVTFTFGIVFSVKEPGLRIKIPIIQHMEKVDTREKVVNLESQNIITKDNITVKVDGVVQYKIIDAYKSTCLVQNVDKAIMDIAQSKIREEISKRDLQDILHNREIFNVSLLVGAKTLMNEDWGIELKSIRIKDIIFDESMVRAMAKRAEALQTAEAKRIEAQADVETAKIYEEAAKIYNSNPSALRLRELEAFTRMAREPSHSTILIPTQILDIFRKVTSN